MPHTPTPASATNTTAPANTGTGIAAEFAGDDTPTVRIPQTTKTNAGSPGADTTRTGQFDGGDPVAPITATTHPDGLPGSVWATAQTSPTAQRKGRYVSDSTAHPAKMLPAVAAHAITHYTRPGDLVFDPMAGSGTTLVEAIDAGRRAVGIEYEPHWVRVAQANLELARERGHGHDGQVFTGDARHLETLLPAYYHQQVALVVTSPPYGPSVHGQVSTAGTDSHDGKVHKFHHRYGSSLDRGNLANVGHHRLLAGFTRILTGCATVLRPGGHVVITARPWREHSELIDLPSQIIACGHRAGLIPVERCVALLARAADTDLVARGSFFQREFIRKQREQGLPLHLIAHEDVICLRKPLHPHPPHQPRHFAPPDKLPRLTHVPGRGWQA
ncbi:TRM11 family SAM-dependent methyltransferase [Sciscionella marina]|uniref:TRM11 family SAM-dependent methyltransferase n=1 Tax=Sciscionella marina TaxID=508770 RepID=UPI000364E8DE|nr:DNA methyltransferase [Sciscionella marina]